MLRRRPAAKRPRFLDIYLNDHFAGATGGVALAERMARSHQDATLRTLAEEIKQDRRSLLTIMSALDVNPARHKAFGAFLGERLSSLKTNGRLLRRSPLTGLIELEALHLGVHGKAAGWRTLLEMADHVPALDSALLGDLLGRAEAQLRTLETMHSAVARRIGKQQ